MDAHAGTSALLGALQYQVPRADGARRSSLGTGAPSIVRNSLAGFGTHRLAQGAVPVTIVTAHAATHLAVITSDYEVRRPSQDPYWH
jgi:hypothetical protein